VFETSSHDVVGQIITLPIEQDKTIDGLLELFYDVSKKEIAIPAMRAISNLLEYNIEGLTTALA
jgi:hypothetical protein